MHAENSIHILCKPCVRLLSVHIIYKKKNHACVLPCWFISKCYAYAFLSWIDLMSWTCYCAQCPWKERTMTPLNQRREEKYTLMMKVVSPYPINIIVWHTVSFSNPVSVTLWHTVPYSTFIPVCFRFLCQVKLVCVPCVIMVVKTSFLIFCSHTLAFIKLVPF